MFFFTSAVFLLGRAWHKRFLRIASKNCETETCFEHKNLQPCRLVAVQNLSKLATLLLDIFLNIYFQLFLLCNNFEVWNTLCCTLFWIHFCYLRWFWVFSVQLHLHFNMIVRLLVLGGWATLELFKTFQIGQNLALTLVLESSSIDD